ncbi:MAG: GTP-binding protein [Planctomyces sp.]
MSAIPVTVVSGFSAVGRNSLVVHLLKARSELSFAVIMIEEDEAIAESNEFDDELAAATGSTAASLMEQIDRLLPQGIIRCTSRDELMEEISNLNETEECDFLIILASSLSEPMSIAETMAWIESAESDTDSDTPSGPHLDTLVTVIDSATFLDDFLSMDSIEERFPSIEDDRDLSQLLAEQIECANVIVLNDRRPADSGGESESEEMGFLQEFLSHLNPESRVLTACCGVVDPDEVLGTESFSGSLADISDAGESLAAESDAVDVELTESESTCSQLRTTQPSASGVTRMEYRACRPFHPQRFYDFWVENQFPGTILRSKGCFWLATRMESAGLWSQAGSVINAMGAGTWWADTPEEQWPDEEMLPREELFADWDEQWGDRRQDLVIIGQELEPSIFQAALDACLLTDDEMQASPDDWQQLPDPFASWDDDDLHSGHDHDCSRDHDHD